MNLLAELDAIDRRILALLQNNARMTNRELADTVGLSPSACLVRVRTLRERGIISRFAAELDLAKLGRPLQALVSIRLARHARPILDKLVDDLANLDETLSVFHLSGEADYMLHLAVRDPEHLRDVVLDKLTSRPEVAQVTTSLVFEHHRGSAMSLEPTRR